MSKDNSYILYIHIVINMQSGNIINWFLKGRSNFFYFKYLTYLTLGFVIPNYHVTIQINTFQTCSNLGNLKLDWA